MFLRKNSQPVISNPKEVGTVIGAGIVLENVTIKGVGYMRVDGTIRGEIQLEGHLILGETGKITGEVHTGSALFFGAYEGNLFVEDTLRLAAGCNVDGNVKTGKLIIDEGADFHGTCNMDMAKVDSNKIISFIKEIDDGGKNATLGSKRQKNGKPEKEPELEAIPTVIAAEN